MLIRQKKAVAAFIAGALGVSGLWLLLQREGYTWPAIVCIVISLLSFYYAYTE